MLRATRQQGHKRLLHLVKTISGLPPLPHPSPYPLALMCAHTQGAMAHGLQTASEIEPVVDPRSRVGLMADGRRVGALGAQVLLQALPAGKSAALNPAALMAAAAVSL